jgi:hypothetical protein
MRVIRMLANSIGLLNSVLARPHAAHRVGISTNSVGDEARMTPPSQKLGKELYQTAITSIHLMQCSSASKVVVSPNYP